MKRHNSDIRIGLRRDRRSRGVVVRPDGTGVIYNGRMAGLALPVPAADAFPAVSDNRITAVRKKKRHLSRKRAAGVAASFVALAVLLTGGAFVYKNSPAVLAVDGENVCYFKHMSDVTEAMKMVAEDNVPEGGILEAIDIGDSVTVKKTLGFGHEFSTPEEAEELIKTSLIDSGKMEITTASTGVTYEKFTPETDFRQDDSMLAGQERVESEAVEGEKKVTTRSAVTNGEVTKEDVLEVETVKEGSPAVIYRGTIGLPSDADWKTYDGPPVLEQGEDMVKLAKKYLGLRYVYGGNSLETGVDCVTFVINIYKKFGINIPHTYNGIKKGGVAVSMDQAQPGDVIVYNGHVAMYMGNGKIIHATRGKSWDVHISNVNYSKKRHIQTVRRFVSN